MKGGRKGKRQRESESTAPETGRTIPAEKKPLNPRQRRAVELYTNPQSGTFGNKTRSAIAAGYTSATPDSASSVASELFSKPNVKSEVQKIFEAHGLTIEDRSGVLAEILHRGISEIETAKVDAEGRRVVVQVTRVPNDRSRLSAIKLMNDMDGTKAKAQAVGHATGKALDAVIDEWSNRLRAELRKSAPEERQEGPGEVPGEVVDSGEHQEGFSDSADA